MTIARWATRPVVKVDGSPLSADYDQRLRRVEVDTDVVGPGSCRLVLDDLDRTTLTQGPFDFNQAFTVSATDGQQEVVVFDGVVVSLGFDFDEHGAYTTVTGFDHAYPLFNGRHVKSYQNVRDSDIAKQIAGDLGLDAGEIDDSPVQHEHVGQLNETHWDFLNRRAAEIHFEVRVDGAKLLFRPATEAGDGPAPGDYDSSQALQLTPGADLLSFSARVTSIGQVKEVEVRGWDVANKQALTSKTSMRTRSAVVPDDPATLADGNGSSPTLAVPLPLGTQAECDARAAAEAERIAGASVHAEGVTLGNPAVLAGVALSVGQAGQRLDGKFTVSRARPHLVDGQLPHALRRERRARSLPLRVDPGDGRGGVDPGHGGRGRHQRRRRPAPGPGAAAVAVALG